MYMWAAHLDQLPNLKSIECLVTEYMSVELRRF